MNNPYYITTEGLEQGTYVRVGAHTVKANAAMINELRWQAKDFTLKRCYIINLASKGSR